MGDETIAGFSRWTLIGQEYPDRKLGATLLRSDANDLEAPLQLCGWRGNVRSRNTRWKDLIQSILARFNIKLVVECHGVHFLLGAALAGQLSFEG